MQKLTGRETGFAQKDNPFSCVACAQMNANELNKVPMRVVLKTISFAGLKTEDRIGASI